MMIVPACWVLAPSVLSFTPSITTLAPLSLSLFSFITPTGCLASAGGPDGSWREEAGESTAGEFAREPIRGKTRLVHRAPNNEVRGKMSELLMTPSSHAFPCIPCTVSLDATTPATTPLPPAFPPPSARKLSLDATEGGSRALPLNVPVLLPPRRLTPGAGLEAAPGAGEVGTRDEGGSR